MLGCCKSWYGKQAIWGDPTEGNPENTVLPVATDMGSGLLTTTNGTWSNDPNLFNYQWYKDSVVIVGATDKSYQTLAPGTYKVAIQGVNINGSNSVFSNNVVV